MKGDTSTEEFGNILNNGNRLSRFGARVNIHWMFIVDEADAVRRMLNACQQNKVVFITYLISLTRSEVRFRPQMEFVRCMVKYDLSLDDIVRLLKNSAKLTLIYFDESHRLHGEESKKVERISKDLGTRLEVLCRELFLRVSYFLK